VADEYDEVPDTIVIGAKDGVEELEGVDEALMSPKAKNLVRHLKESPAGRSILREIGHRVCSEFDVDWNDSAQYRKQFTSDYALFSGDRDKKIGPFKEAANVKLPMIGQNTVRVASRMMQELFGDFESVYGVQTISENDTEADDLSKHGNYQLRNEIINFPREMETALLLFLLAGDVCIYSYYDEEKRANCHETLTPDEFIVPFAQKSKAPDYSDVPHMTRVMTLYRHQLRNKTGWHGVQKVLHGQSAWDDEPHGEHAESAAQNRGLDVTTSGEGVNAPFKVLHYEGWCDLIPGQSRERWIKAIVDHKTKTVMDLRIHERPDWKDQLRFDREERDRTQAKAMRADLEQVHRVAVDQAMTAGTVAPAPLEEFEEPPPPSPPRYVPIRMFTHGVCIESIGTMLGLGFGRQQAELTLAANMAYNQFIDQASLSNAKMYVCTKDIEPLPNTIKATPGKWLAVDCSAEDLKNGILPLEPGPANPQLGETALKLYELAEAAAFSPDVLSGASGKSGETWRGQANRLEQALQQLGYFARKFSFVVERVLINNAYLNSLWMDEEEFFDFQKDTGILVRKEWYRRNYRITFRSDLSFTPRQQKIAEADEAAQVVYKLVGLGVTNPALLYAATVKVLEARGLHDMVELLGAPPGPPASFEETIAQPQLPQEMPPEAAA
jgi:hypothetical protein